MSDTIPDVTTESEAEVTFVAEYTPHYAVNHTAMLSSQLSENARKFRATQDKMDLKRKTSPVDNDHNRPQKSAKLRCRLLELPGELRQMIWEYVLCWAVIKLDQYDCNACGGSNGKAPRLHCRLPQRHVHPFLPVAIRETNHQIRRETEATWVSAATFKFELTPWLPHAFMSKLSHHVRLLRHLDITSVTVRHFSDQDNPRFWTATFALHHLPDLQLDTLVLRPSLTVHNDGRMEDYREIEPLIQYGNGWRSLQILLKHSEPLLYGIHTNSNSQFITYDESPEPSKWHKMILKRDDAKSGAHVLVHRANHLSHLYDANRRKTFRQDAPGMLEGGEYSYAGVNRRRQDKVLLIELRRGSRLPLPGPDDDSNDEEKQVDETPQDDTQESQPPWPKDEKFEDLWFYYLEE